MLVLGHEAADRSVVVTRPQVIKPSRIILLFACVEVRVDSRAGTRKQLPKGVVRVTVSDRTLTVCQRSRRTQRIRDVERVHTAAPLAVETETVRVRRNDLSTSICLNDNFRRSGCRIDNVVRSRAWSNRPHAVPISIVNIRDRGAVRLSYLRQLVARVV